MKTQELKEQAHKEFEKSADTADQFVDNAKVIPINSAILLCNLAIDKTVQQERDRIQTSVMKQLNGFFDWAEQIKEKEIGHWVMMYGASPNEFKQMILSIITNKS